MPDQEDVIPSDSSPEVNPEVTPEVVLPDDRPAINLKMEMDRKFDQLNATLQQLIASQQAPRYQPEPKPDPGYTDQQLQELAAAGSGQAQAMLMERIAQRTAAQQLAAAQRVQTTQAQINVLAQRYPLHDATHPITQAVMRVKYALLQSGQPNTLETDLDAIKTALADNPTLVAQHVSQRQPASTAARPAQVANQNAMTGATPRPNQAPAKPVTQVNPREAMIAQRMGIKDPGKAKERHEKRMAEGRSGMSPSVAAVIREQA